jgi:hypothetical protein
MIDAVDFIAIIAGAGIFVLIWLGLREAINDWRRHLH